MRVSGGAQLVAHVGEEVALGAVGGFGGLLGALELVVGLLALGDVLGDAEQVSGLTVLVEQRDLLGVQPALLRRPA